MFGSIAKAVISAPGAAARLAASGVAQALGAQPGRRVSSEAGTRWIEVFPVGDFDAFANDLHDTLAALPGVTDVHVNGPLSRVMVVVAAGGPPADELVGVVAATEARHGRDGAMPPRGTGTESRGPGLPADDSSLAAGLVAVGISAAGLTVATVGAVLPVPRLSRLAAAPAAVVDYHPAVRGAFEDRLGAENVDRLLATTQSVIGAATAAPAHGLLSVSLRTLSLVENVGARYAWTRHADQLTASARKVALVSDRPCTAHPCAPTSARRDAMSMNIGLAAAVPIAFGATLETAASAPLVAAPKAARSVMEAFAVGFGQSLAARHGALVMNPRVLRRLDGIDTLVVDPRVLYTDVLTVAQVRDVAASDRTAAWRAAAAAVETGEFGVGWHELDGFGFGFAGATVLVTPVRDGLATAVLLEARRADLKVISLDHPGLHSLRHAFDDLLPVSGDADLDAALDEAVQSLAADGSRVAALLRSGIAAAAHADLSMSVQHAGSPPVWNADVLLPGLDGAWRLLHAIPAAREAARRGMTLSAGGSVIGALMLIPGVLGDGPTSVNTSALYGVWSGLRVSQTALREPVPAAEAGHDWYAMPLDEVVRQLPTPDGPPHAQSGRLSLGPVGRAASYTREFLATMAEDLQDPITPILATGAAASALLGSPLDAGMVSGVLLLNTALSAQQSLHAERLLQRMLAKQDPPARVVLGAGVARGGKAAGFTEVDSTLLRPGDVIEVRSGEVVPADARLIDADSVEIDESALTGESLPVSKTTDDTPGAPVAERTGMLFAGTTVVAGRARAIVTAAGAETETNRAMALAPGSSGEIGLAAQLGDITRRAMPWSFTGGGLVGLVSLLRGTPMRETASGAVAIAVAAVPEGLPLVVTLAQSASARRLTGTSMLVRNPRAIEAFARLDAICFDKTGTLSENRLKVITAEPLVGGTARDVLAAAGTTMKMTKSGGVDHATDAAIRGALADAGLPTVHPDVLLPFQSDRPYAAGLVGRRLCVKGAPEVLAAALPVEQSDQLLAALDELAARGLRVLAVAERTLTDEQVTAAADDQATLADLSVSGLRLLGVIGIADTLRASSRPVVEELLRRDIQVRLITGDHPVTAAAIARDLGMDVAVGDVLTGDEWDSMTSSQRSEAAQRHSVFARMSPEHKSEVVQALESAGLVTAMVGDGANDAAAIRAASVGIGVAAKGSDPARMAADVMLLNGDISGIIDGLEEGDRLWRSVLSAVSVLIGHSLGELFFGLISATLTGRPALNARQMQLVNMLTDALPAAALAVSSPKDQVALDGSHDESTIWRAVAVRGVFTTLGAVLAWSFARMTGTRRRADTVGLIGLVLSQMLELLTDSHDPLVVATTIGTVSVMGFVISVPVLSHIFGCTPVGPAGWAQAFVAAIIAAGVAKKMPAVVDWVVDELPGLLFDDENAGPDENRVEVLEGGSDDTDTGMDQGLGADSSGELAHDR